MDRETSNYNSKNQTLNNDEIEIRPIIEKILRNKLFIISFVFISSCISALYAINRPKIWQGEFQIVYDKQSTRSSGGSLVGGLGFDLSSLSLGSSTLQTEVVILKSPYVLMDIYEYVKNKRNDKFLTFQKWVRSLKVKSIPETNVLNVVYKDNDKIMLEKVLEDIAESYELYRKEKRMKDISLSMGFLDAQIKKYEEKANKDYAKLQEYANQQSIYVPTVLPVKTDAPAIDQFSVNKIDSFNKLKEIELNIKQLEKLPIDSDEIFSKSIELINKRKDTIPEYETYLSNEITLSNLRKIFKEEDIEIQSLLFQKSNLREIIREKLMSKLKSEKNLMLSKIDAVSRSQDKLNKYGNLFRTALKSNITLNSMEQKYIQLSLEKTNELNETQLITRPTILPYAVAPQKKRIVFLTFLASSIFASFISFVYENYRNILSLKSSMKHFTQNAPIDHLYINNQEEWEDILNIFIKSIKLDTNDKVVLYLIGSNEELELSTIDKIFGNVLDNKKYIITSKINEVIQYKNIICLVHLGSVKISTFETQISRLKSIPELNISFLTIE